MSTNVETISLEDKAEIIGLINEASRILGSYSAVAHKCGVSPAVITQLKENTYITKGVEMWLKVGQALGRRASGWQTAIDTTNIKTGLAILSDAQKQAMFLRIAEKAGSGKTTLINAFMQADRTNNVFRIVCRDWSKREFLTKLAQALGINLGNGHKSLDNILEQIIAFFTTRRGRLLLIIDQANSLKPSVSSFLIHLFNECEDRLGVIMAGTEHMRTDFERGVKYNRKGYDELDSRFGRSFVALMGNTLGDTRRICAANGIADKDIQDKIFAACKPINKTIDQEDEKRSIKVIEDGRLIKRAIIRHHLLTSIAD